MAFKLKNERKETENKTIRFPLELINDIEHKIANKPISFSRFVIQACIYALENYDISNDKDEKL